MLIIINNNNRTWLFVINILKWVALENFPSDWNNLFSLGNKSPVPFYFLVHIRFTVRVSLIASRKTQTRLEIFFYDKSFFLFLKQRYIRIMIHSVLKLRSPVTFGTVIFSDCSDSLQKYYSSDFHSWISLCLNSISKRRIKLK